MFGGTVKPVGHEPNPAALREGECPQEKNRRESLSHWL
jgi:hypothetical protein